MSTPARAPLVQMGKAVAANVIMGVCIALLPVLPPFIFPFLALPIALTVTRLGTWPGLTVGVVSGGLVYVGVGPEPALLVFLLATGIGVLLGQALRRDWSFSRTLGLTAGGTLGALVIWGAFIWSVLDVHLAAVRKAVYDSIDSVAGQYQQWGMSASTTDSVTHQMKSLVDVTPYLAPGLLVMASVLLAACSMGLAYRIFPRMRDQVRVYWPFSRFRLHWGMAYVSIAGLALILFSRGDAAWRAVLLYVGINLLLASQTLFFVQGLAVVRWFAVRRGMSRGGRAFLYAAAVITQVLFQLTGLVGLFDTWIDYRKRYALKSPSASSRGGIHKE